MLRALKKKALLAMGIFLLASKGHASLLGSYIDLDTGYRTDNITTTGLAITDDFSVFRVPSISIEDQQTFLLGGKLQWVSCSNVFIKADGHYGWVLDGHTAFLDPASSKNGHTSDASLGFGYYSCLCNAWNLALSAGWSYDYYTCRSIEDQAESPNPRNMEYTSRFQGPWIGVGLIYQPCDSLDILVNYELHHGCWKFNRENVDSKFLEQSYNNNMWGQVVEFDTTWTFENCWHLGCDLKWKFYHDQNQKHSGIHYKNSSADVPGLHTAVTSASWQIFTATVHFGRSF
ncbi:MAG: hypothetical protein KDK62_02350 [Chlamydiia bacterium]|nr:hypothetical protein [Chlamydiia bacterium]